MDIKDIINRIRGLGFMAGVLERQSREPLCSRCISYAITAEEALEALRDLKGEALKKPVPDEFREVLISADAAISGLCIPGEPLRQRKIGSCHLPDKACFVKKSRMLFLFFKEKKKD